MKCKYETCRRCYSYFFFFNDTATTEIYTLSLHDALPICRALRPACGSHRYRTGYVPWRSEEHTSELQSHSDLVCRLLLEKKQRTGVEHYHPEFGLYIQEYYNASGVCLDDCYS